MMTCPNCGRRFSEVPVFPLICSCGTKSSGSDSPNPWSVIHSRYASSIKSSQWHEAIERNWLNNEFAKLVPCGSCGSKWLSLSATIDLSTAENAFHTLWQAHNTVSTEHVQPPLPAMSYEQCRELWLGPKVAFIAVNYAMHGGTETFHQTLLPRLRHYRNVVGFGAIHGGGNPALLKVPYHEGRGTVANLCTKADIVVTWGIDELTSLMPERRPKVIAVHHGDQNAGWIGETIWQQGVDEFVCVNRAAADYVRTKRDLPVHWIPNALDESRTKPTAKPDTEGKRICLFGHRMSEEKRPELAIEIAKALPDDWLLVMAGDGPLKPTNPPANVRLVGRVDSLANWLSVSSCFISLSTFEGFGLSMAEAHAMDVPIVATPVGIAPDVAATLLPVDSKPEQWAKAIVESVGKQNKPADFSVEKHVADWAAILK
jgi:glycosyltransferase involved in cell wall biosynthesis